MASKLVAEAIARYNEATGNPDFDKDKFYPEVNRAMRRAWRFGGAKTSVPGSDGKAAVLVRPGRSRIQRGISRPGQRGTVLREGLKPIFVEADGSVTDMAQFYEAAA